MSETAVALQVKGPTMPVPVQDESAAIISMIERAARDPSVDLDRMERLLAMHRDMKADRAKASYNAALARLQSELPAVERKGKGHNDRSYARFEDFVATIRPKLKEHGFSLTHRIHQPDATRVDITAVLAHRDGHEERTALNLPLDTSGNKVPVHALASSVSYGKRYTGFAITGIASEDEDDDGNAAGASETISEDHGDELRKLMDDFDSEQVEGFCRYFKIKNIGELPAKEFDRAKAAIAKSKAKRAS